MTTALRPLGRSTTRLAAVVLACVSMLVLAGAAKAETVFPVINTSEQPPDGVYFRYGPDPSLTTRTTGLGVYMSEHVRVKCYWAGTAFGPFANTIWYYAYDVERPTVGAVPNEGWINAHYVDDGMTADHAHPSVPRCASGTGNGGAASSPQLPPTWPVTSYPAPAQIYFSPYNRRSRLLPSFIRNRYELRDQTVKTVYENEYAPSCRDTRPAYTAAMDRASGRPISTLAGWSAGRLGVLHFLEQASETQRKQLDYVILIDPGNFDELECDRDRSGGALLAQWLAANPAAHLVVMSGKRSQEDDSRGIQESYFNAIRAAAKRPGSTLNERVVTCNYGIKHEEAFRAAQYWIRQTIGTSLSACPWLTDDGVTYKPVGWHPSRGDGSITLFRAPVQVHRNATTTVRADVGRRARCSLLATQGDRTIRTRAVRARRPQLAFSWRVPPDAAAGRVAATVRCVKSGAKSLAVASISVVAATAGDGHLFVPRRVSVHSVRSPASA